MEYKGKEIPQEICEALAKRTELLSSETTLLYAQKFKIKGIRLISQNVPKFRDILCQRILKAGKVSGELQDLLETLVTTTGCFAVLSTKAITNYAADWLGFFGEADTLGCWLFDARTPVKQTALRRLGSFPDKKLPSPQTARKNILENFKGFLSQIRDLHYNEGKPLKKPASGKSPLPADAIFGEELRELREKAGKVRGLQHKVDKTSAAIEAAEKQQSMLQKELDEFREGLRKLENANRNLESILAEERRERAARIRDEVAKRLEAEENRWLRELNRKQQILSPDPADTDLLQKAEAALHHQSEIDQLCGNRQQLEKELRRLEDARQNIRQARLTAINPLRELTSLEEELEKRCKEISTILDKRAVLQIPAAFVSEIEAAATAQEFKDCRRKLKDAFDSGFLDAEVRDAVSAYIYDRELLLHLRQLKPRSVAPAKLEGIELLTEQIRCGEPFKIWLDGHNIINGLEYMQKLDAEGKSHKFLRDELIRLLRPLAAHNPKGDWVLVFDAAYPSTEKCDRNFRAVFSGGGEQDHKADMLIIGEIQSDFSEASALSRYIVSDDKDLCRQAAQLRAVPLSTRDLEIILQL